MNLFMMQPKNKTEDLFPSITKNCETHTKQTHTRPEETLEFKITKPKQTYHFNHPNQVKGDWVLELTSLEMYNSIFNITKKKQIQTF